MSEVAICNRALTSLGQDPITSMDDNGTAAEWMKINYPILRDALLEARKWTFATVKAISTTAARDGWDENYAHEKPINWISVYRCYRDPRHQDRTWRMENGSVVSQYATVYLWGIERVTDTNRFSPGFTEALAARIAAEACIPFTENRQDQVDKWSLYNDKLAEASALDGQQGANEVIQSNSLIEARYGSRF